MNRRALLGFIFLNILVTFVTVFAIISIWQRLSPPPTRQPLSPPIIVVYTSTPDPRGTQVYVTIVTATPQNQTGEAVVAANTTLSSAEITATAIASLGAIPTLDPALLPASLGTVSAELASDSTVSSGDNTSLTTTPGTDSNGCQTYVLKSGDTAGSIAQSFGVSLVDLMQANNLNDSSLTRLQIGQQLTVPVNGCGLSTPEPTGTPTRFILPTAQPTITLAPTAANAKVQVVQVISPGDITSEGIELSNVSGGVVQMQDWTLTDGEGHTFTFPEYRMFPGGHVTIYTRNGVNTPIVLYWKQQSAVWTTPGQHIQLSDNQGTVQATYSLPSTPAAP